MSDAPQTIASPRRRFWARKRFHIPLASLVAFVLVVGPWPIYTASYQGTSYANATFDRVDALPITGQYGPLQFGVASRDITPPIGQPMAGFGARKPKRSEGIGQHVYAKAITLSAGGTTVTIVGGDILLFMPQLRDEVLRRTKLPREAVYFTATHTHSGPGGYSSRWVDQLVLGDFDQAILDKLAGDFADVILESRKTLSPGDWTVWPMFAHFPSLVVNRLSAEYPAENMVYRLTFAGADSVSPLAKLFIASAHPTCYGSSNRQINGDYPGLLQEHSQTNGDFSMFAAGAVGSMTARGGKPHGIGRATEQADGILGWVGCPVTRPLPRVVARNVMIQSQILTVDLPVQQYRFAQGWRLSPVAAGYLHGRQTYIHVLRIRREGISTPWNDVVLLGMPADYSGELALRLADQCKTLGLLPIVTSFNGDYVGYLLPQERYWLRSSETLDENLFGPWCGEYFNDLCLRLLKRMHTPATSLPVSTVNN